jgi:transposase-like protein
MLAEASTSEGSVANSGFAQNGGMPNGFKRCHFPGDFILLWLRWYLKFNVSYRHLAEMMQERGFEVHHTTIYRWIQRYAPQLEKLIRWYQGHTGCSWRVDETYSALSSVLLRRVRVPLVLG